MRDMEKLCKVIEEELHKIAEKGLNTGNLDTAYKLIDMYKDLKNTEYWEGKLEYYMEEMGGYSQRGNSRNGGYSGEDYSSEGGGYSGRRKRDSRGRYSREGGSYDGGGSYGSYAGGGSYGGGESLARGRSNRGGSSRAGGYSEGYSGYDRYMDSKESYRSSKSPECKQRLMSTLEDYMEEFTEQMEEMLRDSDCAEERTTIKRYLEKIKNIA